MDLKWLFIPAFGAFVGWMANYLTLKMLFHPHQPRRMPILHYELWGTLPRRQEELAVLIGEKVEGELLSTDKILAEMRTRGIVDNLSDSITTVVRNRVMMKIPALVPRSWRNLIGKLVEDILKKEIPVFLEESVGKITVTLKGDMHIRNFVEEKIKSYSTRDMEKMAVAELRGARIIGAIAGLIIGIIVMLILSL